MAVPPVQRGQTMIALRARREALHVASDIVLPALPVVEAKCPGCRCVQRVIVSPVPERVQCLVCRLVLRWPAGWIVPACADEAPAFEEPLVEAIPVDAVQLSCRHCRASVWFMPGEEDGGLFCLGCGNEFIEPSAERRARIVHRERKLRREQIKANVFAFVMTALAVVGVVALVMLTPGD